MSDDEEEPEPTVDLGTDQPVEGAPLSRVAARHTWPKEKSEIVEHDGDETIRSADGPIELSSLLEAVDDTYFASQPHFLEAVREELPTGTVPTAEE